MVGISTHASDKVKKMAQMLRKRMVGRPAMTVGATSVIIRGACFFTQETQKCIPQDNIPIIERSFRKSIALFEAHFATDRLYLLGSRPSVADFSVAGQLYELLTVSLASGFRI